MLIKLLLTLMVSSLPFINYSAIAAINPDKLFEHSKYQNAKISPDGQHLAVAMQYQGKITLVVLGLEKMKLIGSLRFPGNEEVGSYHWVNNERLVVSIVEKRPWLEEPQFYGELYAVNFDGSKGKMIYGYRAGEMQTGSRIKKKESTRGWGEIIDILPEDKKHILISSTLMSSTGESTPSVHKLNVYTGVIKKKIARSPLPFAHFLTDQQGQLRAVVGTDKDDKRQLYLRKDHQWQHVNNNTVSNDVIPFAIDASGKYLFTIDNYQQDLTGIFKLNLNDLSYSEVFTDQNVDVTDIEMTTNDRSAYAIRVDEGYPTYLMINGKAEEAKVFKDLLKSFPYNKVTITSKTADGNIYIVLVSSDISAGQLYLFDKKKNQLKFLFKFKADIESAELAQVEPIKFTASDGQNIHGYFTPAKGSSSEKIAPLVVLVHGGPHGVRDFWSFSAQVQYLALNGYSVLQVNYRGSGGYGEKFELAGHRAWGNVIQQDILDGYSWLISQKKATSNNACIMGASFGAYSAIQSAAIFPDSYQCAIANAGIYDLELMFDDGDIRLRRSGLSYLKQVLGTDQTLLKQMSPVNYAQKIKIPLFLAHGKEDERAPYEHAKRLRKALDKANKSYQWFVLDKEGHGFYNPENQKNYMKKVIQFLDQHLTK
ncbi:MAG: S9 family peptidase [Gammaproteobacteria bacterium]|nr:S9 family peptidase [Gammaproteobacteria bacterium]